MSDGGPERVSLGVEVWKSSQKWSVQRSAVRSIAWLDPSMWTPSHISGDFNIFVSFLSFLLHGFCRNHRELQAADNMGQSLFAPTTAFRRVSLDTDDVSL